MTQEIVQTLAAFLMASSLTLIVFLLVEGRRGRIDRRLRQLSGKGGEDAALAQLTRTLPRVGAALAPPDEEERGQLRTRLIHAGLYGRETMFVYLGVKLLLIVAPPLVGVAAWLADLLAMEWALLIGAALGIFGMIAPSFWLDFRKTERQRTFRRALPDALDVLVICLEGGLSLMAAIKRVGSELSSAHPELGLELRIVEREIQLGRTASEALRSFADRTDLEELRNLSSVVGQSERFGASLVRALRVHAETLREKRLQHAEERAQRAATLILFPTLLFIFPGVFVVILGPAVLQIWHWLEGSGR